MLKNLELVGDTPVNLVRCWCVQLVCYCNEENKDLKVKLSARMEEGYKSYEGQHQGTWGVYCTSCLITILEMHESEDGPFFGVAHNLQFLPRTVPVSFKRSAECRARFFPLARLDSLFVDLLCYAKLGPYMMMPTPSRLTATTYSGRRRTKTWGSGKGRSLWAEPI